MIPIGTDNPLKHTPILNYILIILNFVIFFAVNLIFPLVVQYSASHPDMHEWYPLIINAFNQVVESSMLHPGMPQLYQFITYAFLHSGWMHIIGNMLFLYVFGNNVNDKLGNLGYLLFYLGGAIFSGVGHILFSDSTIDVPVLGASGAVAAVTGAYMVLFPKTYIHIIYILFFVGTAEIPAIYFILFKLIIYDNIIGPIDSPSNIAYNAHLAGYLFGIVILMLLLILKLLPHSHYDLWALVHRWRQRFQYRNIVGRGYDPFSPARVMRTKKVDVTVTDTDTAGNQEIANMRSEITDAIYQADLSAAACKYLQLMAMDGNQVLPQQQQLDIANKLMHTGQHTEAAHAYEVFLNHYQRYAFIEQVELMLGLLYSRYLDRKDLARTHLQKALEKLSDPGQKQMCQDELSQLD